ncbi:MAG: AAA family ATPase [Alphaproteobacteria bacterium]|nr:AAA family ATPase [Alphaproteobacteria bacterium]
MKFSRLKIHGFKSFCDATEISLDPGLTGVVGPNGCGKSNLVEALRWVMGESSYKAMRASGMDDVIFAGSGNRPGRNSAEVTLVLDNEDRTAPAPLNTADLLEVTRRIERESGSVYRVNGREVRARDVQLLFADSSTGARSPALVRQGQIGELIAAKPVQRRALLEEAAGISGLYSRRHEAELRLKAAEQNLERVDDIVGQIEQQLDTLRRQARLAVRYRSLSGDIRKAEAALFHLRWVRARVAEKETEASQAQQVKALGEVAHQERVAATALADFEARLPPLRQSEAEAGAVLQRYRIMAEQLEDEIRRSSARRHELETRQKQLVADRAREDELVAEAETVLAAAAEEIATLNREAENEREDAEAARMAAEALTAQLAEAERRLRAAAAALADLRARREAAERHAAEAVARAERLGAQFGEIETELAAVGAALAGDSAVMEKQAALDRSQALAEAAEAETLRAESESVARQAALDAARPQLSEWETALGRLESEAQTLAKVLNIGDGALWPAIVDALSVAKGYETALGAALGDDLDASSDSGAPLHWSEPGDGATDPALPDGARPFTEFVKGAALLDRRLRQIGLVAPADGPRLMTALKPGQRLVSRDGALWRWDGFVAAADAPSAAAQRLAQRNRLSELDAEIADAKARRDTLRGKIDNLTAARAMAHAAEQKARAGWRDAQHAIRSAQAGLDAAQKALGELARRQSALSEARERLGASLAEAKTQAEAARSSVGDTTAEKQAATALVTSEAEAQALRDKAEQARLRLGGFEGAARMRAARLKQLNDDSAGWTRRRSGADAQAKVLNTRAEAIAGELKALDEGPADFDRRRIALNERIETAATTHKQAGDALAEAETAWRDADRAARAAHDAVGAAREELARSEERQKGLIIARRQIEQLCLETLSLPADRTAEAAGIRPEAPLPREEDVERKVERLKLERERLGGVNLGAEREAEETRQKLDALVADREDVVAAIAKLRTGISSLNREGRARLNEAFDTVNAHFRDLFTSLFGGGTAELTFVESDDPLEAGLEIIARPPGKKPQTMTLLSGGEQALTALSLIFAVFLTNPAPICVLDEVDAPLDDANVERFCDLLDNMRTRTETRFMVITHNPITMSRVDRLFGVTMAERGVSQVVSVDLSTAKAVAEAS